MSVGLGGECVKPSLLAAVKNSCLYSVFLSMISPETGDLKYTVSPRNHTPSEEFFTKCE